MGCAQATEDLEKALMIITAHDGRSFNVPVKPDQVKAIYFFKSTKIPTLE